MKKETLVCASDHIRILQKLNESYEDNPTKEAAQKIIDYVDNEISFKPPESYDSNEAFAKQLLAGVLFGAILDYFIVQIFGLDDKAFVGLSIWFMFSALITYGIRHIEKKFESNSLLRHYWKLKEEQYIQKKQDEIKALEAKYLDVSADAEARR